MIAVIGIGIQIGLAGILLVAGLQKAIHIGALSQTIRRLGLSGALAPATAATVVVAELVTGVALLVVPSELWPRAATLVLAATFAGAGAVSLLRADRIECNCFGRATSRPLGVRQVAALPVWVVAVLLTGWAEPHWSIEFGALLMAALLLVAVAVRAASGAGLWRELRADRLVVAGPLDATLTAHAAAKGTPA